MFMTIHWLVDNSPSYCKPCAFIATERKCHDCTSDDLTNLYSCTHPSKRFSVQLSVCTKLSLLDKEEPAGPKCTPSTPACLPTHPPHSPPLQLPRPLHLTFYLPLSLHSLAPSLSPLSLSLSCWGGIVGGRGVVDKAWLAVLRLFAPLPPSIQQQANPPPSSPLSLSLMPPPSSPKRCYCNERLTRWQHCHNWVNLAPWTAH